LLTVPYIFLAFTLSGGDGGITSLNRRIRMIDVLRGFVFKGMAESVMDLRIFIEVVDSNY